MEVEYGGDNFPLKYLSVQNNVISSDLEHYIKYLSMALSYFNDARNDTDINTATGAFFSKSVLKRTLLDYSHKMIKFQKDIIRILINMNENILSHYMYQNLGYGWDDLEFRASRIFLFDDSQIYSIAEFNRNLLKDWILSKENKIHNYTEEMDTATLLKEKYGKLTYDFKNYTIDILSSDFCLAVVAYNKESIDFKQLQKCEDNAYCEERIFSNPSIGYSLSHRLLNAYLRFSTKRCYIRSEVEDKKLMDQLCANMYRESVYLARRGYFARDLFLEHIALCGLLGYEEFYRRHWFYKATSWVKEAGCVAENRNFLINITDTDYSKVKDVRKRQKYRKYDCEMLNYECHDHPTAVLLIVLAHAIRYAAHIMTSVL
ncbi:unnamed protein product [Chilo suppressalis]|uniref:Uncharacterized protein n=1 Tax=Chilo suppressalis TaxID=168631 RepID=A0ABN8AUA3_CHISP|nr:hypothetical protein evm_001029 [Chilo suppressalis]CAH0397911.1 unnamed protein product [Chilo suppressalis]